MAAVVNTLQLQGSEIKLLAINVQLLPVKLKLASKTSFFKVLTAAFYKCDSTKHLIKQRSALVLSGNRLDHSVVVSKSQIIDRIFL